MRTNPKKKFEWNSIFNYKELLISMYVNQKLSLNKIAMHFNTSSDSVKNILKELGINIRDRRESFNIEMERLNVRDKY